MANNTSLSAASAALEPLADSQRVFSWHAHASLWFSLGVGLLVIQVGAYLVPGASTRDALLAVLLGSVLGAALLGWTARLGCNTGLSSAALMNRAFGRSFSRLPIMLNIAQLIGWTTFELVIMRDGTLAILRASLGLELSGFTGVLWATVFWGVILLLLLSGSMTQLVRRFVGRFGLPLVVASLVWLTWQFGSKLQAQGMDAFWSHAGDGSMGTLSALDLVIGMPISWLPLVADYARHGKTGRGALGGTFLGYAIANIWCYALGVVVASVSAPRADLVATLLLAQGGLIALSLVLIDEIDNAYGDVYSASVSAHTVLPAWSMRLWGLALAGLCTALAMVLPMHSIEPFLLMLSSVFVPLYGVLLGRLYGASGSIPQAQRGVYPVAAVLWLAGVALYHGLVAWAPQWGAALPTLGVTFGLAWLTRPRAA
jgi:putative hydroxymethylpyrimidine transporter CytX